MTPGWLDAAVAATFGDDAPACTSCGDERQLRMVSFAGDVEDAIVPCPFCRPRVFTLIPWRRDVPRTGGAG